MFLCYLLYYIVSLCRQQ